MFPSHEDEKDGSFSFQQNTNKEAKSVHFS